MKLFHLSLLLSSSLTLSACLGSPSGLGMAVGQQVGGSALNRAILNTHAQGLTCEELEADIAARERGKINPLSIPSINRQIAQVEAVARDKGCPGFTDPVEENAGVEEDAAS